MANWTKEQLAAITARNSNLLVAAAAGSGKTAVLVERILRLICDPDNPADVNNLLVVTFTEAAAGEMRDRIGKSISDQLRKSPSSQLERQLALLNTASFSTLHSFCFEIIRQYYYLCGLDPAVRVADVNEADLLKVQALEELLEECYARSSREFSELIDCFGGERDDKGVKQLIFKLHEFARSNPDPKGWLENKVSVFKVGPGTALEQTGWWEGLQQLIVLKVDQARSYFLKAMEIASKPNGPVVYCVALRDDLAKLEDLAGACSVWDKVVTEARSWDKWSGLKPCKNGNPELKEEAKKYRDKGKEIIDNLKEKFLHRSSGEWLSDFHQVAPLMKTLGSLVNEFSERYQKLKHSYGLVDYADLEHYCLKILGNPEGDHAGLSPVARELRERYTEVLVDEYQDINPVQDAILNLVSRQESENPNLFMVGDVKQSIYGFRLTEPKLFLDKYAAYSDETEAVNRKIDLAKNFRSRAEVVDGVNFIFRQLMTSCLAQVDYAGKAELVYGADYPQIDQASAVELHLIDQKNVGQGGSAQEERVEAFEQGEQEETVGTNDLGNEAEEISATEAEAKVVARRIKEFMQANHQVYDQELGYRPVRYRDMVILMRATSNRANIFLEEFGLAGIPAFADLGTGYLAATEVETMIALMQVIDNPQQDIPLAAVLRSPIVGLNSTELVKIRLAQRNGDFYQAAKIAAEASLGELSYKLNLFLQQLKAWRTAATQGSLSELLSQIYRDSGYLDYVTAMPGGTQRQANLKALYDRACKFEQANFRGLFRFLRLIEDMKEKGKDLGEARALGENEDVVRIMSIHKSKGLEFPVVIVAGLGKQFNTQDTRGDVLLHKDLGLGPQVVDIVGKVKYPSIAKLAICHKMEQDLKAEEMRILYVALTRAREKLILVGSTKGLAKQVAKWCRHWLHENWQLPEFELAAAKSYLDWISPAIVRHSSASELCQIIGEDVTVPETLADDPSCWDIKIWNDIPVTEGFSVEQQEYLTKVLNMEPIPMAGMANENIKEILDWTYPNHEVVGKQAKFSVTEVKRMHEIWDGERGEQSDRDFILRQRPSFMQEEKKLSPAEKGSAYHLVMQHLDLKVDLSQATIRGQIKDMIDRGLLSEQQAAAVEPEKIAPLFNTVIGKKMLSSAEVLREIPFSLSLSVSEIYPELIGCEDKILLQGVIDCLIKDEDGYILVDWKTDATTDCGEMERRYKNQLELYAQAVERIFKWPIKERYIYMMETGTELKL